MTSAPNTSTQSTSSLLELKPDVVAGARSTGYVDGAWRPASRDLAAEVPALLAELPGELGTVERISYHLATWGLTVRALRTPGGLVHLAGYRTQHPDTVDVVGNSHRVTLLVVPPETDDTTARRVMAAASDPDNIARPADLLATEH
ncbi:DUF5994 family protein [Pseudonocardia spinosispora]|uniref:DUF5994 family protein n=1 Tax=Pseudonocardia spinosispora TaxID=103441 RepID=UPI0007E8C8A2|nr:DUF5994 family protein [Pseudonocardia spinosispora]